jgi:transposase
MPARTVEDEDYQLRHEKVAGRDIAKASGMACLRLPPEEGKDKRYSKAWETGAAVTEIEALAGELTAAGVELVSMESTSDYWRAWFVTLEAAGLAVQLVSSCQAKNLPGRPKTGKDDSQRIARLTETGLLRPSFVPPPEIRALRRWCRVPGVRGVRRAAYGAGAGLARGADACGGPQRIACRLAGGWAGRQTSGRAWPRRGCARDDQGAARR